MGILTGAWLTEVNFPYPDFSVWHKCRKWEPLVEFANQISVDYAIKKPQGVFEYEHSPGFDES